ncbi:hypothetical protein QQF21_21440 [Lelliottia sp. V89_10]|uniref:hypothetical protein n=1 Tax=Lelliottia wanjuensis TaxID=3050585 RepID=UPI00254D3C7E|nr:hypothetical protein [Lelliottia sp. V89_5]MDK9598188.1 hypothetical protein [Lelliottia sp. V89_10]
MRLIKTLSALLFSPYAERTKINIELGIINIIDIPSANIVVEMRMEMSPALKERT